MNTIKWIVAITVLAFSSVAFADSPKIGFIYIGPPGDHGWTYMHDQGRQDIEEELGFQTTYIENVPENADAVRAIRKLAQSGHDLIFTTSFNYMDQTLEVAKDFPDVKFEHATGYMRADNVATYSSRFYEGRTISGHIAGKESKSGVVGYIASYPIPEVVRGINAFYLGATSVNPKFDIDVVWVYTWYDPVKEGDAAKVLISEGADIITQHTDSPAALQIAEKAGVMAFGQASDMIQFAPKAQLTAIIDDWAPYYVSRVQAVLDGTWKKSDTWGDMKSGMVKMAPYTNMPRKLKRLAKELEDDIRDGKIDPFGGKYTTGELLGMNKYVKGIDSSLPK